jgi:hypothetical protein
MKKKFLGIPVVLIVAFLLLALTAGVAYAAVNLLAGSQATVQVSEAIYVEAEDPVGVVPDGGEAGVWTSAVHGDAMYSNTWVLGTPAAPIYPGWVATMPVHVTNLSTDLPVAVTIRVVPKFFPGSDYLACGVSMTVDTTGMMVYDPITGTAIQAGEQVMDPPLFGPTTSVTVALAPAGTMDMNVTFVAGNDAVAGAYAYDIIIERAGVSLPAIAP